MLDEFHRVRRHAPVPRGILPVQGRQRDSVTDGVSRWHVQEVLVRGRALCASSSLLAAECTLKDGHVAKINVVIAIEYTDSARLATDRNARPAQTIDNFAPIVEVHGTVQVRISEQLACVDEQITVAVVAAR